MLYSRLHEDHQAVCQTELGWRVCVGRSSVAGRGGWLRGGGAPAGTLLCLYPGTVYQPYQPVLLQSGNSQLSLQPEQSNHVSSGSRAVNMT